MNSRESNGNWSEARLDRLTQLAGSALSASEIAGRLNTLPGGYLTRNAVIGKAGRLGLKLRQNSGGQVKASPPPKWSEERTELLRTLWVGGLSESQIALRLSDLPGEAVTRLAVGAKASRMGLSSEGRQKPAAPAAIVRPVVSRQPPARPVITAPRHDVTRPYVPRAVARVPDGPKVDGGVSLLALGLGQCKFVIGHRDGEAMFCGAGTARATRGRYEPYCVGCKPKPGRMNLKADGPPLESRRGFRFDAVQRHA